MTHVKFVLEKELNIIREYIENYNATINRLIQDIEKIQTLQNKFLGQEIELVKALALLEELKCK